MRMSVALPGIPTHRSATSSLDPEDTAFLDAAIPEWVTAPDWATRARFVEEAFTEDRILHGRVDPSQAAVLALRVTALLEQAGATQIDSIEQAWLFMMAPHSEWRAAARRWLTYAGAKRTARWVRSYPATFLIADGCRKFREAQA